MVCLLDCFLIGWIDYLLIDCLLIEKRKKQNHTNFLNPVKD